MKHAFLIMAHQDVEQLIRLISALDSEDSLFYIHWDKKQEQVLHFSSGFQKLQEKNNVFFVESIKVYWGGISLVMATIELLKSAIQSSETVYFHLLSGIDYPLKPLSFIFNFFAENNHNYLLYIPEESRCKYYINRYYFYDTDYMNVRGNAVGYKKKMIRNLLLLLQRCTYLLVQKLGLCIRKKVPMQYYHGSQWFSFTREAVDYILKRLSEEDWILKRFKYTAVSDESFFTMLIMDNPQLRKTVINDDLRLRMPDGSLNRGGYIWVEKDFESIQNSPALFGRKFRTGVSDELLDRIDLEFVKKDCVF